MKEHYDLVFWQNMASIHQAPLMRALANGLDKRVLVVVAEDVSADRLAMGWEGIDYGNADLIIEPSASNRKKLVENNRGAVAHVFSGASAYPAVQQALTTLTQGAHNHVAIITEPWDPRGVRGALRALRFGLRRRSLRGIDTLFVCGDLAKRQFTSLGFEPSRIAPFGYFVDGPDAAAKQSHRDRPGIIFVGSLTTRKDPKALIEALAMTPADSWELTIVGDGPLLDSSIKLVKDLRLGSRVFFTRNLANGDVLRKIAVSDLLVLTSKYDGWGAVVSEALMAGTPVVVSRECGASDLVRSALQGEVIQAGHPTELARALVGRLSSSPLSGESRAQLENWAHGAISPKAAAQYLWDTVTRGSGVPTAGAPWNAIADSPVRDVHQ
ncbi:glycosyltransferase [Cryobacterium sp. TMT2-10]|uniref:glycosyltransferase n=1 Tax=Cryobacterium sp. TMT2-10 TaxID=1259244 RepID=UPI00106A3D69|nr:glycosyltransferase [Cryobacterium sp. TMT2-10]TFD40337.1 glycosyltransferase [Cryobacterium sp. TMT2-10]